jgi:acyl-CoA reductase-like NAD-dependent aldehyde dehydrogenase
MNAATLLPSALGEATGECRRRQQAWARLPVRQRLRPVRQLRRLLVTDCDRLAADVARDLGKPCEEILAAEVLPLAAACQFLEREAGRLLRPQRVPGRHRPWWLWGQGDTLHRRPRGLVGIIGTWNYPLLLNGVQIVQALTAGNGVLWKPSELAPASAAGLHRLLEQAGFPDGLVHRLEATREAGRELADADVDHLVFTGSAATGRALAGHLGRRLVSSTLELSGCDAMFVLEDADVSLAARAAWFGATLNRGQTCVAVRRVLVQRGLYPQFIDALKPLAASAAPVRLALASQARQAEELVRAALAEGAHLVQGPPGLPNGEPELFPPTVIIDASPEMAVCREASFAPLLAVLPFDTVADAVRLDAHCPYGLGASIFTGSKEWAAELAGQLRVGMVTVNDVIVPTAHPATPFGGRGASGWGVTQGALGLLEMTVPQVVSVRGGTYRPHYEPPGSSRLMRADTLRALLAWGHGTTFGQRCRGLLRLLRALCG